MDYRSTDKVKRDILKILEKRMPVTKLLKKSHTSYNSLQVYLQLLLDAKLIFVEVKGKRKYYKTTKKGEIAIAAYDLWDKLNSDIDFEKVYSIDD